MTQDQSNFNWQAYLSANPDVAASSYGSQDRAWEHYSNYGINEGRQATFNENAIQDNQANNQANFDYVKYLKDNPDVAASSYGNQQGAWEHYSNYGVKEGRQATFDLGSKNTLPSEDKLQTDSQTGLQYSTTPGHVGYVANVPDAYGGTTKQWMPSAFDFTGAKYNDSSKTYTMPSGEKIGYDSGSNNITSYDPVYDKASTVAYGSNSQVYSPTSGQKTANFQGLNLGTDVVNQGEFLVDPNTKQYYKDTSGNPIPVYHQPSSGGFDDFMAENGWMLPLAMATAGAGAYALGGEAAAGGGLAGAELAGPSFAGSQAFDAALASGATTTEAAAASDAAIQAAVASGQGIGTVAGGTSTGITSTPGADQILNQPNVNVNLGSNLPSGASGGITAPLEGSGAIPGAGATTLPGGGLTGALPANVMVGDGTLGTTMGATYMAAAPGQFAVDASGAAIPSSSVGIGGFSPTTSPSISTSDVSNAYKLAKALTSQAGSQLSSAAQNLATGQTGVGMALPNLVRGNQSPFTYTAQQPIRDAQPMDLNSLANLLKQG